MTMTMTMTKYHLSEPTVRYIDGVAVETGDLDVFIVEAQSAEAAALAAAKERHAERKNWESGEPGGRGQSQFTFDVWADADVESLPSGGRSYRNSESRRIVVRPNDADPIREPAIIV